MEKHAGWQHLKNKALVFIASSLPITAAATIGSGILSLIAVPFSPLLF
ncbi:hypothetical protein I656_02445 [Geobacillus sp. WSUCF1]|nr:hypothetical protein I656_02445 [Geobacillus sp. WSUCF1]